MGECVRESEDQGLKEDEASEVETARRLFEDRVSLLVTFLPIGRLIESILSQEQYQGAKITVRRHHHHIDICRSFLQGIARGVFPYCPDPCAAFFANDGQQNIRGCSSSFVNRFRHIADWAGRFEVWRSLY